MAKGAAAWDGVGVVAVEGREGEERGEEEMAAVAKGAAVMGSAVDVAAADLVLAGLRRGVATVRASMVYVAGAMAAEVAV